MNNLHPGPLTTSAEDDSRIILSRPIAQLLNRLDAVLLVQKSCKEEQCMKPWDQLHPGGQVRNLKDALVEKFDDQYAKYAKVKFDRCFKEPVYQPWAEGPQWRDAGAGTSNLLMRDGLNWDTWA